MNAATNTAPPARFTFSPGALVLVLGPTYPASRPDFKGRGVDGVTGLTMEVVEHRADDDVVLINEAGDPGSEVWIHASRLIAD